MTRRGDRCTFRSRRLSADAPAVFQARYRPTGPTSRAAPGTLASFCVEQFRYYVPATDRRIDPLQATDAGVRVGRIDRDPWDLTPAGATIHGNTLFKAAGLPAPTADPVVQYSPGFEMDVAPPGAGGEVE